LRWVSAAMVSATQDRDTPRIHGFSGLSDAHWDVPIGGVHR